MGQDHDLEYLHGLIFGGLIGLGLGVIFAPLAGEEVREKIKNKFGEIKEDSGDSIDILKNASEKIIQQTKESIEEGLEKLETAISEAKKTIEENEEEEDSNES